MLDWLRLFRVSGFCTLASNLLAAISVAVYSKGLDYRLLGQELYRNRDAALWVVLAAVLLFAAGMAWNDIADVDRDRRLNPRRPLPSGRIGLPSAVVVASLAAVGALLAGSQLGMRGFCMSGIILSLSLLYNFVTKHIPYAGSLTMALVRANFALFCLLLLEPAYFDRTLQTVLDSVGLLNRSFVEVQPVYPLLLGLYVGGVTVISELETRRGRRLELLIGGALVTLAVAAAVVLVVRAHWVLQLMREGKILLMVVAIVLQVALAGWILYRIGRPLVRAVREARRDLVPPVLVAGLTGIVLFDGLIACAFHPLLGLAAVALYLPFKLLALMIRMD